MTFPATAPPRGRPGAPGPGDPLFGDVAIAEVVVLHRGSTTVGYKAQQLALDRTVFIKVLHDSGPASWWANRRRVGVLVHPHVVRVYGRGRTTDGRLFFVMPFLPSPYRDILVRDGPLPWPQVLAVGVKLAGALATAHAAGWHHGSVGIDALLRTREGEPVLCGLPLARIPPGMHAEKTRADLIALARTLNVLVGGAGGGVQSFATQAELDAAAGAGDARRFAALLQQLQRDLGESPTPVVLGEMCTAGPQVRVRRARLLLLALLGCAAALAPTTAWVLYHQASSDTLSPAARALLDPPCRPLALSTAPPAGLEIADVRGTGSGAQTIVHGTARLAAGEQLYAAISPADMCGLYLVPRPVAVQRDGGWMAQVDLRAAAGKDARIVMARVDATGAQALTAVSLYLIGPSLHINALPAGADVVTVKVGVDATGKIAQIGPSIPGRERLAGAQSGDVAKGLR